MIRRLFKGDSVGVYLALLIVIFFFSVFTQEFATLRTWSSILTFASTLGVIAIGASILMSAGEFDLSVGSVAAFSGMLFAMAATKWSLTPLELWFVVPVILVIGAFAGWLNGWVTLKTGIPSFIVTLGAMLLWRGVVLAVSGGFPISLTEQRMGPLSAFGASLGYGFSNGIFWWLGLTIFFSWLLTQTSVGNWILATGGNPHSARVMGVPVSRIKLGSFVLSGVLASFAGMMLFSQLQDLSPTAGESYELYAIAAAVIGGTALSGGVGSVLGAAMGTILMGVIQSGLVHLGVDSYWFRSAVGILLVFSVLLNQVFKKIGERSFLRSSV